MREAPIVVCPRCGKKYKLKEGFNAAAFACKECGATVKVAKAEAPVPTRASPSRSRGATARAPAARAAGHARAGRARRGAEEEASGERRHARPAPKKASGAQVGLAVAGLAILVGLVAFFALRGGKQPATPASASAEAARGGASAQAAGATPAPAPAQPAAPTPSPPPPSTGPQPGTSAAAPPVAPPPASPASGANAGQDEAAAPKRRLVGTDAAAKSATQSRYDPPADIPHLDTTPPEERERIDKLVAQLMDPEAGKDSLRAKEQLVLIGKPAFPRVLAAMAKIRDVITDVDSMEERMQESSLRLADLTLREMDGYLNGHNKPELRPGSEKKYIEFVCRMHYKRWVTELSKMDKMPGPFDPSVAYSDRIDEEEEGK